MPSNRAGKNVSFLSRLISSMSNFPQYGYVFLHTKRQIFPANTKISLPLCCVGYRGGTAFSLNYLNTFTTILTLYVEVFEVADISRNLLSFPMISCKIIHQSIPIDL